MDSNIVWSCVNHSSLPCPLRLSPIFTISRTWHRTSAGGRMLGRSLRSSTRSSLRAASTSSPSPSPPSSSHWCCTCSSNDNGHGQGHGHGGDAHAVSRAEPTYLRGIWRLIAICCTPSAESSGEDSSRRCSKSRHQGQGQGQGSPAGRGGSPGEHAHWQRHYNTLQRAHAR